MNTDWICGIRNAIDSIEDSLTEEIDYEEEAKQNFSSSDYFQRISGLLCGYTRGEYIRLRRMSLAGAELDGYTRENMYNTAVQDLSR